MNIAKIGLIALASSAGLATAADFVAEFDGIDGGANGAFTIDGSTYNAGHMKHTYSGPIPTVAVGQFKNPTFLTFCIELQNTSRDPEPFTIQKIGEAPNPTSSNGGVPYGAADEAEVHSVVAAAVRLGYINADLSLGTAGGAELAAIQGLIWKVLFDGSTFVSNYAAVDTVIAAIEAERLNDPFARVKGLRAMTNPDAQDQLYVVPLPPAALAGLAMLGGIAGVRVMRRR